MSTIRDLMQVREIKAGFPVKDKNKNAEKKAEKNSKEGGKQIVRAGGPGSGRHPGGGMGSPAERHLSKSRTPSKEVSDRIKQKQGYNKNFQEKHPAHGTFSKTSHEDVKDKTGHYNGVKTTYESSKGHTVEMHDHAFRGTNGTVRFRENGKQTKELSRHDAATHARERYGIRYKAVGHGR